MLRRLRQHRAWFSVLATTAALGLAYGQGDMDVPKGPPKAGDVITLKFADGQDRQFKVLKVDMQPDGSYLSEVKDTKSGEIITLYDKPSTAPAPPASKSPAMPARTIDQPAMPANSPAMPDPAKSDPAKSDPKKDPPRKDSWLPKIFSSSKNENNSSSGAKPAPDDAPDPPKKPGLLGRIFGPKKPPANTSSTPSAATQAPPLAGTGTAMPPLAGTGTAMPPPVRPTPGAYPPAPGGSTSEPPRVAPSIPLFPSQPSPPATTIPMPPATQSVPLFPSTPPPAPASPRISAPPAAVPLFPSTPPPVTAPAAPRPMTPGLPTIPMAPPGTSTRTPPVVQAQARQAIPAPSVPQEVQGYAATLRMGHAPSDRIFALQALVGSRHASSDAVKAVIFNACVSDPCPLVRACCIDELCTLGYFAPAFLAYLKGASDDLSPDVRTSARAALRKLSPESGEYGVRNAE